jgi:hypothetical protein
MPGEDFNYSKDVLNIGVLFTNLAILKIVHLKTTLGINLSWNR